MKRSSSIKAPPHIRVRGMGSKGDVLTTEPLGLQGLGVSAQSPVGDQLLVRHLLSDKPSSSPRPSSESNVIRVLIVEGQALVRAGLRALVESRPGLQVVGETGMEVDARAMCARGHPDVVVFDPDPGGERNLHLLRDFLAAASKPRILVLAGAEHRSLQRHAVGLGAVTVLLKTISPEAFFCAIEKVRAGKLWIRRSTTVGLLQEGLGWLPAVGRAAPSRREDEVIDLVCEGLRNGEIARRLFISEATVRHHLTSIFAKLGLSSRCHLIVFAHSLAALVT